MVCVLQGVGTDPIARVVCQFDRGQAHVLNRYWTRADYPRPESYKEDLHHAGLAVRPPSGLGSQGRARESLWPRLCKDKGALILAPRLLPSLSVDPQDCAQKFYAEIAAGAESGWDFSSRWIPQTEERPDNRTR